MDLESRKSITDIKLLTIVNVLHSVELYAKDKDGRVVPVVITESAIAELHKKMTLNRIDAVTNTNKVMLELVDATVDELVQWLLINT